MPISPFRLKSTLGRNYKTDPQDTRRAKEALQTLRYYETPSYGLTDYPDEPLFTGIENFQNDNGLRRDGIMKPGGETEAAVGVKLASLNGEDADFSNSADDSVDSSTGLQTAMLRRPDRFDDGWATEGAFNKSPWIGGGGGGVGGGGGKSGAKIFRDGLIKTLPKLRDLIDPFPQTPPDSGEPPETNEKEEILPAAAQPTVLTHPITKELDAGIYIYEQPDDELRRFGQNVESNENAATKRQHEALDTQFQADHPDYKFLGAEYHIPGPLGGELGGLMLGKEEGKSGDGRQGGYFADRAYLSPDGETLVLIQTVDVDSNDNVTDRELRNAEGMRRLAASPERDVHVLLIKKLWQLERNKARRERRSNRENK